MTGQWIFIEPDDVWLFRDNKPFSAGQNFVARGIFPPTPMTIQGAVRTYYLEQQTIDWEDYKTGNVSSEIIETIGLPGTKIGNLRIEGPFVAYNNGETVERFYRTPLDLLHHKDSSSSYSLLKPAGKPDYQTNLPFENWQPLLSDDDYEAAEGWLSEEQFNAYLDGKVTGFRSLTSTNNLYQIEDRVGLGLDYNRRANQESLFYRAEFIRTCPGVGLMIWINLPLFDAFGTLTIGGESRVGKYRMVEPPPLQPKQGSGRVRIVLLTPAYFRDGWQPKDKQWSRWVGGGKLVSIVVGKPLAISGWDVANNRPKPLRHFVPAGSVYYFENADVTGEPFTESLPDGMNAGAMGFGTFAVGTW